MKRDMTARPRARSFVRDLLADGPIPAAEGRRRTQAAGFKIRTIDLARKDAGIRSVRDGRHWVWLPPPDSLADLDLAGADDRLAALDGLAGRESTPSAAACSCARPVVDRDARCVRCGREATPC